MYFQERVSGKKKKTRITFDHPIFDNRKIEFSPELDAEDFKLEELGWDDFKKVELASQEFQDKGKALIERSAQLIGDKYHHLLPKHKTEHLGEFHKGTIVVDGLDHVGLAGYKKSTQKALNSGFGKIYGVQCKPYQFVILDTAVIEKNENEQIATATHELWHALSDSTLPNYLDEAATDYFTESIIQTDSPKKNSLKDDDYESACELWDEIVSEVSVETALSAYLEPHIRKGEQDKKRGKVYEITLVDPSLHDILRIRLGIHKNKYAWDSIINLLNKNRGKDALALFQKAQKKSPLR